MTDRQSLIRSNLGVSKAFSPAASDLNDRIQELLADAGDLEPAEQIRLLNGLIGQMSAQINRLL